MTMDPARLNPVLPNNHAKQLLAMNHLETAVIAIQEAMALLPADEEIPLDTAWLILRKVHKRATLALPPKTTAHTPAQRTSRWFSRKAS